jgi:uncharacterized protein (TIGR02284 family)
MVRQANSDARRMECIMTTLQIRKDSLETVRDLIRLGVESFRSLVTAADMVTTQPLKSWLEAMATRRRRQMQDLCRQVGDAAKASRDASNQDPPRWWVTVRRADPEVREEAVIAQTQQNEDLIRSRYEAAIQQHAVTTAVHAGEGCLRRDARHS